MVKNILSSLIGCKSLIKNYGDLKGNITNIPYNKESSIRIVDINKECWSK